MSGHASLRDSNTRLPGSWPELSTRNDALERVINTVELCEQILGYLPCADLTRARAVCRQFDAVISQSTLLRQRSSLRLASNQIVWVSPTDDTLLTGIYAEDYIAAARAKGQPTFDFSVYEMHPYLRVEHVSPVGHRMAWRPSSYFGHVLSTGNHNLRFGNLCLTEIPDNFPLDDTYICQPPVKHICASMSHTHEEDLHINNDNGITFGDVRRAVKEFLREGMHDPDLHWQPCRCTTTVTAHESDVCTRWTIGSSLNQAYNYRLIAFDCVESDIQKGRLGNVFKGEDQQLCPFGGLDIHNGLPITTEEKPTL